MEGNSIKLDFNYKSFLLFHPIFVFFYKVLSTFTFKYFFNSQIDALFKRIEICMNQKDVNEENPNIKEKGIEKGSEKDPEEGREEVENEVDKEVEKEVEVSGRSPLKVRERQDACHLLTGLS